MISGLLNWLTSFLFPSATRGGNTSVFGPQQAFTVAPYPWPKTGNIIVWKNAAITADNFYFGGWFQKNGLINLVAAMCMVESSGGLYLSRKVSAKDTSYGVMQVTPYTASDVYRWGYTTFGQPTVGKLTDMPTSLYFGMAYVKILRERFKMQSLEQLARGYNGGAGWNNRNAFSSNEAFARSQANTLNHWNKIKVQLAQLQ